MRAKLTPIESAKRDWDRMPKARRPTFPDFWAMRMTRGFAFLETPKLTHEQNLAELRIEAEKFLTNYER